MLVEFSITPIGTGSSISAKIADVLKIVGNSGLPYKVNPMGTVIEGDWDAVMGVIRKCHDSVMAGGERAITTMRVDDRKGHSNMIEEKVRSVEEKLGAVLSK